MRHNEKQISLSSPEDLGRCSVVLFPPVKWCQLNRGTCLGGICGLGEIRVQKLLCEEGERFSGCRYNVKSIAVKELDGSCHMAAMQPNNREGETGNNIVSTHRVIKEH